MDPGLSSQIRAALDIEHSALSSQADRREAESFLLQLKQRDDAALIGFALAAPHPEDATLPGSAGPRRHFGFQTLLYAIQYQASSYDSEQRLAIRRWILELAESLTSSDPPYLREKAAVVWSEWAKRTWGVLTEEADGWASMDSELLALWQSGDAGRDFTLSVFRTLFEDVFVLEDSVAIQRSMHLTAQITEVVCSGKDIQESYDARAPELEQLRADPEQGWLQRWCISCQDQNIHHLLRYRLLETVKCTLQWVLASALINTDIVKLFSSALSEEDVQTRIVAVDALQIIFMRRYSNPAEFEILVAPVFETTGIEWLYQIYHAAAQATAADIDNDEEYSFCKKLSELLCALGDCYIGTVVIDPPPKFGLRRNSVDLYGFLSLMVDIAEHPSLVVAGMSLQFWCSLLRNEKLASQPEVERILGRLLSVGSERCVNHSDFPDDHPTSLYMAQDFDTSDASSFYGSFRRYMEDTIRLIVCRIPEASIRWLHERMMTFFQSELGWRAVHEEVSLENHSDPAFVLGCAQIGTVEAAIRGVVRWQIWAQDTERDMQQAQILALVAEWARELVTLIPTDHLLHHKVIECLVQFAPLVKDDNDLLFSILQRVFQATVTPGDPAKEKEFERVRDLRTSAGTELNRLAYMVPESLAGIYDRLEAVVSDLLANGQVQEHESVSFKSFLLVVSQRSELPNKEAHFSAIVDPVLQRWNDPTTIRGLNDLEWFMENVGIVRIEQYFQRRGITEATNLQQTPMDDEGRALKLELKQKWQAIFPVRPSRIFVQYTIERLNHNSPEFQHLLSLWSPRIKQILPCILQLLSQIMAFHNPSQWTNLPPRVQTFVRQSTRERFWQVGISMQTRDEFENESMAASKTLRDFADSVGHIIRYTREYTFLTLGSISQLEGTMYEIDGMGIKLYEALAGSNTEGITSHCWRHMISLVVRNVVNNCPIEYQESFLGDFLPPFLSRLTAVLRNMWSLQEARGFQLEEKAQEDELSEEMMDEYLLRQFTVVVNRLVIDLVGQARLKPQQALPDRRQAIHELCRQNPRILASVLELSRTIMGFRDSRCCYNICLVLRHLLINGVPCEREIEQYFVEEIMPACLQTLGDLFFIESSGEAASILTLIYLRMSRCQPSPAEVLSQLLSISNEDFAIFDRHMHAETNLRVQRAHMLDLLKRCDKMSDDRAQARKRANNNVPVTRRNVNNEEDIDAAALISMFGDN